MLSAHHALIQAPTSNNARVIPYAFPTKPSNEPFACLFCCLCLPGCHSCIIVLHQDYLCHCFGLYGTVYPCRLYSTAIKLLAEWQIRIESLLGLPMHGTAIVLSFSVHSTIFVKMCLSTRQKAII